MTSKTVFIVDDNQEFRSSIAWMLKGEGHMTVEFDSARKALNALRSTRTDELDNCCMLLDVRMPEISGPELHDIINSEAIPMPIVYMTGHADVAMAVEAMSKGAVTFLEKPLREEKLLVALESAFSPVTKLNPGSLPVEERSTDSSPQLREMLSQLTPRESEVLDGIVDGQANKVIAFNLGISVRTVEVHRARLMKKLGTRSATELIKKIMTCQQTQH